MIVTAEGYYIEKAGRSELPLKTGRASIVNSTKDRDPELILYLAGTMNIDDAYRYVDYWNRKGARNYFEYELKLVILEP